MFGGRSGRLPSNRNHSFAVIPDVKTQRSVFNRTHGLKTTFGLITGNFSGIYPVFVDEILPGDTMSLDATAFARLQTPVVPLMDNLYCDFHFFFVPNRLVWNNWQKFMGEQIDPDDSIDYLVPTIDIFTNAEGSLADYFGLPMGAQLGDVGTTFPVNALPFRAYNKIWNDWFRDENFQDSVTVDLDDGPDTYADYANILPRGKRKDYFTGALPWPQKGPDITLPLGEVAPVLGIGKLTQVYSAGPAARYETGATGTRDYADYMNVDAGAGNDSVLSVEEDPNNPGFPGIYADLSSATAATINSLREAFQLQRMLERDARGGTRYTEILLSHFGVVSPDARLQRSEFLGGGTKQVNITPVPQTSETGTTPQGNLSAFGTMSGGRLGFTKSFTEHGWVIGVVSMRADLNYQNGANRMWLRQTRYDYYWPTLAHLGEQEILNAELWATGIPATDAAPFGYQERYGEYRYKPSMVTGKFRSDATGSLDVYHLAQDFSTLPVLGEAFIKEAPPIARVIAVPTEPAFMLDMHFNYRCARPMPVYSEPGLIDHF